MQLIGSTTSPYVRRIRFLLENKEYDFQTIDVFSKSGQAELKKLSPIARVPILITHNETIFDSYLITKFLLKEKFESINEEELILINEASDSGIFLLQMMRFGLDENLQNPLSRLHYQRIEDILVFFNENQKLAWDIAGQWLFCLLDWLNFRAIYNWDHLNNLKDFYQKQLPREIVKETDPRI